MDDEESKDQSTVNDDLELSDDEMDKDSGSSSSNEAGCLSLKLGDIFISM